MLRRRRAAIAFAVVLTVNAVLLAPLWVAPAQLGGDGASLRLLAYNLMTSNSHRAEVCAWLNGQSADVLILQEVNQAWVAQLDRALEGVRRLPTHTIREDNFGMAVYVREGLYANAQAVGVEDPAGVPRIEVALDPRRSVGEPHWCPHPPAGQRRLRGGPRGAARRSGPAGRRLPRAGGGGR